MVRAPAGRHSGRVGRLEERMIPEFKFKIGRLAVYSTERFYSGWVEHFGYIRQKKALWRHYVLDWHRVRVCTQVRILGFIFTWWAVDCWMDDRPTQWDRLLDD